MERRLGQVDLATGEVMEQGFVAYIAPKRINGFGQRWMAMAQDAAMLLAQSDLGADDMKVFFALVAKLDYENLLVLNQAEVARELGMQRQNVQRSMKRLLKMEVILEGPKIGLSRSYRFNPSFGWKGTARNHVKALSSHHRGRMEAAGITGVIKGGKQED